MAKSIRASITAVLSDEGFMGIRIYVVTIVAALVSLSVSAPLRADSVNVELRAVIYADLNGDCVVDTVLAEDVDANKAIIREVAWGSRAGEHCDSLWYSETSRSYGSRTVLSYDTLDPVQTSLLKWNANDDGKQDLMLIVRGKMTVDSTVRDTLFRIAIYCQRGLDTLDTLRISCGSGTVHDDWTRSYVVPGYGMDAVSVKRPTLSFTSLQSLPVTIDVDTVASEKIRVLLPTSSTETRMSIQLRPNPTTGVGTVTVTTQGARGRVRFKVLDLRGVLQQVQEHSLSLFATMFGVDDLAPGCYIVVAESDSGQYATIPMVHYR